MKCTYIFLLLSLFFIEAGAQQPLTDSAFYALSVSNIINGYKNQVKENLHIYNGSEYFRPGHGVKGTPFFESDSMLVGSLFYDGSLYENIPLSYDLVTDNVIINNYQHDNILKLVPEKLNYFYIAQHLFVRITSDSLLPSFITTGFYEKLYDGKLTVFARYQKVAKQSAPNNSTENVIRYLDYNNYFVLMNNTFYKADDKKDFLALMADKKEEIKKYMKENKIKINNDNRGASMKLVAEYYSQLKN